EGGHAGAPLEVGTGVTEERGIAPEPVDDEAAHQPPQVRGQQLDGAVKCCDPPATIDVADDDGPQPGGVGQGQVDDVPVEQVDLGRAAGTLADHDVVAGAEVGECLQYDRQEVALGVVVVARGLDPDGSAHHDHLAGTLARGRPEEG